MTCLGEHRSKVWGSLKGARKATPWRAKRGSGVFASAGCGKTSCDICFFKAKGAAGMADRRYGGISLGGIIVIVGIVLMFIWSFWIGLIIALIGLIAFGGFARGKWY
jgi:hypothetical protein